MLGHGCECFGYQFHSPCLEGTFLYAEMSPFALRTRTRMEIPPSLAAVLQQAKLALQKGSAPSLPASLTQVILLTRHLQVKKCTLRGHKCSWWEKGRNSSATSTCWTSPKGLSITRASMAKEEQHTIRDRANRICLFDTNYTPLHQCSTEQ